MLFVYQILPYTLFKSLKLNQRNVKNIRNRLWSSAQSTLTVKRLSSRNVMAAIVVSEYSWLKTRLCSRYFSYASLLKYQLWNGFQFFQTTHTILALTTSSLDWQVQDLQPCTGAGWLKHQLGMKRATEEPANGHAGSQRIFLILLISIREV